MSGTNDFQPLAIGGSANVISQAQYLALTALIANGFSSGLATSAQVNKVLRQATVPGAALAQLMCDTLGINISDDGNLAGFEANLKLMLQTIGRIKLTANTTFFVSPTGGDSNTGLTIGSPWLTLQHAWSVIQNNYDLNGFTVLIQTIAGTFGAGVVAGGPLVGAAQASGGTAAVTINLASGVTVNAAVDAFSAIGPGALNLTGPGLVQSSAGNGISALYGGLITYQGVNFGACAASHIACTGGGSKVLCLGSYSISGNAASHYSVSAASFIGGGGGTVTATGTPTFSNSFAQAFDLGMLGVQGQTYSGAVTGKRYANSTGGWINTGGGGASYFPGNSAGTGANYA